MWRARAGLGLAVVLYASAAQAHIIYGTKTLRGFVAEADLVLHARILATDEPISITTEKGAMSRPTVEAEVLDVLKGSFDGARVRFAQHGHGVASFEPGSEALLFLLRIERNRELAELARSGAVAWVSLQEHDDAYPLRPGSRDSVLAVVRSYVAAAGDPKSAATSLRRATVGLLTSGDADLAASALRDLAVAPPGTLVTAEDLPALLPLLDDPGTSMGVRCALLTELERRQLLVADPVWLRLLATPEPTRDRITAVRAAGAAGRPALRPRLIELLQDPEDDVAAAAAAALGRPGDGDSVEPLEASLRHDAAKVRMAAIRGLGRIGTPAADTALRSAAASHPDPATRRRARAELAGGPHTEGSGR